MTDLNTFEINVAAGQRGPAGPIGPPGPVVPQRYAPGNWYQPPIPYCQNLSRPQGYLSALPMRIDQRISIDALGVRVDTAGPAGTFLRLGAWACGPDGFPNALIIDAGQVAAQTAGSQPFASFTPIALDPDWYWFGVCPQGAGSNAIVTRGLGTNYQIPGTPVQSGGSHIGQGMGNGFMGDGAFPAFFGGSASPGNRSIADNAQLCGFRVAP